MIGKFSGWCSRTLDLSFDSIITERYSFCFKNDPQVHNEEKWGTKFKLRALNLIS